MEKVLEEVLEENQVLAKHGKVASYIPALSKVNPNHLGICIIDANGNTYKRETVKLSLRFRVYQR